MNTGVVVTEPVCRKGSELIEVPVGYLMPIRATEVQGDYYDYADMQGVT